MYQDGGYVTLDTRNLPDGTDTLTFSGYEATDAAGTDSAPVTGTLTLAVANPSVAFTSPATGSVVWGTTTWTVDAQPATGGAAVAWVEFYSSYNKTQKPLYVATSAPYTYTANESTVQAFGGVEAVAVDEDGNRSAVASTGFTAEPGPAVTATSPGPLLGAEGAQNLFVDWSGAVASGLNFDPAGYNATTWLTGAQISVDGKAVKNYDLTTWQMFCALKPYHCLATTPWSDELELNGLPVGDHTVTVTVTDNHGGVGSKSLTAIVGADKLIASVPGRTASWGSGVGVYGTITDATGSAVPGTRLALQARPVGSSTWSTVATQTPAGQNYSFSTVPRQNESLRVVELTGTRQVTAATSVTVQPKVAAKLSAGKVTHGHKVTITGQVSGSTPGGTVRLLVDKGGKWVSLSTGHQSASGKVTFTLTEKSKGTFYYRLYTPGTTAFLASYSNMLTLHVI